MGWWGRGCRGVFVLLLAAAAALAHADIDLHGWDPERDGLRTLDGPWDFLPGRLVAPGEPWPAAQSQAVRVPHEWPGGFGPRHGAGTYRTRLLCGHGEPLALALPFQHSAVHVYANGQLIAEQGRPGLDLSSHVPSVRQQIVPLPAGCPVELRVQVSNFDLYRGGFVRAMVAGTLPMLEQRREDVVSRNQLAIGVLLFPALFSFAFWLVRPRDTTPLLFGLFSLTCAVSLGMAGERSSGSLANLLGFDNFVKLLYLNWFLALGTFPWVLHQLYARDGSRRFVWTVSATAGAGALLALVAFPRVLTWSTPVLTVASVAVALYMLAVLVRALFHGHREAALLIAGVLALSGAIANDLVLFQGVVRTNLLPWGIVAFVLAPAILLAQRFARALSVEELRAIEQQGRADLLVRATNAGVLDWDAVEGVTRWSDRYHEMFGWRPGETMPPFTEMVHPEDRDRIHQSFIGQLRDRSVRSGIRPGPPADYRMLRRDGSVVWVHAEAISLCGDDGRTLRYICTFIDITALKATEQALYTERERLRLLVRSTKAGFGDWDALRDQVTYTDRFVEMLGYPPGTDTSKWPSIFEMMHPDDRETAREQFRAMIRRKAQAGEQEPGEPMSYRLRRADGQYIWIHAEGISQVDDSGRTVRFITSYLDVTRFREQEEQLRRSRDQVAEQAKLLEQQNETLKENVRLREEVERIGRHDIKTPLNSIVAVPRLLREERKLGPEADELLGIVERAGYRILSMVNLSLDLYKMEQGTYVFRPDAVDLIDLTGKVLADMRVHAESKRVTVRQTVRHLPYAWAEELLCYSLLANLLKNAVEASPEGAQVWVRPESSNGEVRVRIHNQGAVPAAIRDTFFQKYASLGKASGTGLGTYSARLMARVQDGDVTMETSDETGTTVTVVLREAPDGAMPATTRHIMEKRGVEPEVLAALPPTRVLLVDDDEYNLLIVRRFLPEPPFTVETAINGRVAVAAAAARWPDLVFMDLDMPVMGGMQAVRELRNLQRANALGTCRIVALSSHDDAQTREAAIAAGFDRYLTKPVTREAIQETLLAMRGAPGTIRVQAPAPTAAPREPGPDDPVVIDEDILPMLGNFLASRRTLLADMVRAIERPDRAEVRRIAHQLAGSFALYGFHWASRQARWIEHNAQDVPPARVEVLAEAMAAHMDKQHAQLSRGDMMAGPRPLPGERP